MTSSKDLISRIRTWEGGRGEDGERAGRGWEEDGAQLTVEDGYFANTKT